MSQLNVDTIVSRTGGSPTFSQGAVVTGVATATSFSGNATGLTGTPSITVADITGIGANLSGITTTAGIKFNKQIFEEVNVTAGKLSDNTEINISNGQVHLFTTACLLYTSPSPRD